jgi:hypothetical protein
MKVESMLRYSQYRMDNQEIARAEHRRRRYWTGTFLRRTKHEQVDDVRWSLLDVYEVSVASCFIPSDFSEEMPLYILDTAGAIMILYGQWIYDPHVMICSKAVFDSWHCERAFFVAFNIRCSEESGEVFQLSVQNSAFVETRRLSSRLQFKKLRECQVIPGVGETLVTDLEKAGLIEEI